MSWTDRAGNSVDIHIAVTEAIIGNTGVDYSVESLSATGSAVTESPISGSFTILNNGDAGGNHHINWMIYASTDTAGTYYLIVTLSAGDENDTANNTGISGAFQITAPGAVDYAVTGGILSETFDLRNFGDTNGSQDVQWTAYISVDTIIDDPDDTLAGSGTTPMLAAGDDAYVSSRYIIYDELESDTNNDDICPTTGELSNVHNLGILTRSETLVVQGTLDGAETWDTYRFQLPVNTVPTDRLRAQVVWETGSNALDLWYWDENNGESSSVSTLPDEEPGIEPLENAGRYYLKILLIP